MVLHAHIHTHTHLVCIVVSNKVWRCIAKHCNEPKTSLNNTQVDNTGILTNTVTQLTWLLCPKSDLCSPTLNSRAYTTHTGMHTFITTPTFTSDLGIAYQYHPNPHHHLRSLTNIKSGTPNVVCKGSNFIMDFCMGKITCKQKNDRWPR